MTWNLVDALLAVIVLLNTLSGLRRGFILGIFDLLRWVLSLLLGLRFYQPLARWIGARADWAGAWDQPVAFLLIVITAGLLMSALERRLLRRLPAHIHVQRANRLPPGSLAR